MLQFPLLLLLYPTGGGGVLYAIFLLILIQFVDPGVYGLDMPVESK